MDALDIHMECWSYMHDIPRTIVVYYFCLFSVLYEVMICNRCSSDLSRGMEVDVFGYNLLSFGNLSQSNFFSIFGLSVFEKVCYSCVYILYFCFSEPSVVW